MYVYMYVHTYIESTYLTITSADCMWRQHEVHDFPILPLLDAQVSLSMQLSRIFFQFWKVATLNGCFLHGWWPMSKQSNTTGFCCIRLFKNVCAKKHIYCACILVQTSIHIYIYICIHSIILTRFTSNMSIGNWN